MANLNGMASKFIVVKVQDVDAVKLDYPGMVDVFYKCLAKVNLLRKIIGKKENNTYLVINTDEPYADEVIEIMKRHGHWG